MSRPQTQHARLMADQLEWERALQSRGSGASLYVNVPSEACDALELEKGDKLEFSLDTRTGELTVRPAEE